MSVKLSRWVWLVGLAVVVGVLVSVQSVFAQTTPDFEDVPDGHVAESAIEWAAENEITVGVGNNRFGIGQTLTRYEMVTFLCRAFSPSSCLSGTRGSDRFGDVPVDHWANYPVGWAVSQDITSGVSLTEFGGPGTLIREQMMTFLYRAEGSPTGGSLGSNIYEDVPDGHSQWANLPIGWAFDQGISGGIAEGTFGFGTHISREEMVLFLCRALAPLTCPPSQRPIKITPTTILPPWSGIDITPPPSTHDRVYGPYDPFYTQAATVGKLHVIAGDAVNPEAVQRVAFTIAQMLENRPHIADQMARYMYVVVGSTQSPVSSVPEVQALPQRLIEEWQFDMNRIIGGGWGPSACLGCEGGGALPFVMVSEANAMCSGYPIDTHTTEDVVVHELAHGIHNSFEHANSEAGLALEDTFDHQLQQIYEQALADGLWEGPHYGATNHSEYFAEIFQFWSGVNDNDAVWVDSFDLARQSAELAEYDPRAATFLREHFGEVAITASCHYYGN